MKVELIYEQCIWQSLTFDITDSDCLDYINWCNESGYEVEDLHNLIQYLENNCSFKEDIDVDYSNLEDTVGLTTVLEKCKNLVNDN